MLTILAAAAAAAAAAAWTLKSPAKATPTHPLVATDLNPKENEAKHLLLCR